MWDCNEEVGLPESVGAGLGLRIARGDNDALEGAVDKDQVRSPTLVRSDKAELESQSSACKLPCGSRKRVGSPSNKLR